MPNKNHCDECGKLSDDNGNHGGECADGQGAKPTTQKEGGSEKKKPPTKKVVKVNMDAEVQKQLSAASTPKERQKIAFRYIMDNLRGVYEAPDGRTVAIERKGADKMTSKDYEDKLRVCPALADMIRAGTFDHTAPADPGKKSGFVEFAYYTVHVRMGDDEFTGMLNVGIRDNGTATLYDLNPFKKDDKKDDK